MKGRLLIVDDEIEVRKVVTEILKEEGYEVLMAANGVEVLPLVREYKIDIILIDIFMPGIDGFKTIEEIREVSPESLFIIISAYATPENLLKAAQMKVHAFLEKPLSLPKLTIACEEALRMRRLAQRDEFLRNLLEEEIYFPSVLWQKVENLVNQEGNILIVGEKGMAKKALVYRVFGLSEIPFVEVKDVSEEELFGCEAGVLPGVLRRKVGKLEKGAGGVIFINNINALPQNIQLKLGEVFLVRKFSRLGGKINHSLTARLIATVSEPFSELVESGKINKKLAQVFHQVVTLPPLRAFKKELPEIAERIIKIVCQRENIILKRLSRESLKFLENYSWPGNLKELFNVLERAILLSPTTEELEIGKSKLFHYPFQKSEGEI